MDPYFQVSVVGPLEEASIRVLRDLDLTVVVDGALVVVSGIQRWWPDRSDSRVHTSCAGNGRTTSRATRDVMASLWTRPVSGAAAPAGSRG